MPRIAALAHGASVALFVLAVLSVGVAQPSTPSWVIGDESAYVEAYRFPDTMAQVDTAVFVLCDAAVPGGVDVRVWFGLHPGAPRSGTIEVLTRRGQDEPRRSVWRVYGDGDRAYPLDDAHLGGLVADVIDGGDLAVRVIAVPGLAESAQPTFQYALGSVEPLLAALPCLVPGTATASHDPFAGAPASPPPPEPARPSAASPRSGTAPPIAAPSEPVEPTPPTPAPPMASPVPPPSATVVPQAPPSAAPPASGATEAEWSSFFHPVTDLFVVTESLAEIAAVLPARARVATSDRVPGPEPSVTVYDARGPGYRSLVLGCTPDIGAIAVVASPALLRYGDGAFLWFALFAGDEGLGEAEIVSIAGLLDGTGAAVFEYGEDVFGVATAVRRYGPALTVVIFDDEDAVVDAWDLDVSGLRPLVDTLPCM